MTKIRHALTFATLLCLLVLGGTPLLGSCEECKEIQFQADFCWPVANGDPGNTGCVDRPAGCIENGDPCTGPELEGGDGGGGGGDRCTATNGFCPAECISCDPAF